MKPILKQHLLAAALVATVAIFTPSSRACTGITLTAQDGAVVYGRTMEWGSFDLLSRVVIIPRGHPFAGQTPDHQPGKTWTGTYGIVGLDAVEKDFIADGMNEKGLTVGLFYHPGFAEYPAYDPALAADSISPLDVGQFLLSQCTTVEEARSAIAKVRVVPVVEPAIGIAPPLHYFVTEPSGKAIVIEFLKGEMKIFDNPLGVLTNAPSYDWHETNLRNYINLSLVALPSKTDGDLQMLQYTGAGSGMRFCLYVHHDDAAREFAYDRRDPLAKLDLGLDEATKKGWTVVSMKNDWNKIFPAAEIPAILIK